MYSKICRFCNWHHAECAHVIWPIRHSHDVDDIRMVKYHIFNIKCMNATGFVTAQRSAHEQPTVDHFDLDHCSVLGGLQMILRGQNFTSESKVIFFEKTHGE